MIAPIALVALVAIGSSNALPQLGGFLSMFSAPSLAAPSGLALPSSGLALPSSALSLPSSGLPSAPATSASAASGPLITLAPPSELSALNLPTATITLPSQLSQLSGLGALSLSLPTIITNSNPLPTNAFTLSNILPSGLPVSLTGVIASTPSGLAITGAVGALGGAIDCIPPLSLGIQAFVQLPNVITVCVCVNILSIAPGASPCPTCPAGSQQICSNGGCGCTPATSTSVTPSTTAVLPTFGPGDPNTNLPTPSFTPSTAAVLSTFIPGSSNTNLAPTDPITATIDSTANTLPTFAPGAPATRIASDAGANPPFTLPSPGFAASPANNANGGVGAIGGSSGSASNGGGVVGGAAGVFSTNAVSALANTSPTPTAGGSGNSGACVVTQYAMFTTTVPACSTTTVSSTVTVTAIRTM